MEWMPIACGALLIAWALLARLQDVKSVNAIKALWDEDRQRCEDRVQTEWQRARAEVNLLQDKLEAARESQAQYLADTNRTLAALKIARGTKVAPEIESPRVRQRAQNGAIHPTALPADGLDRD